MTSARNRCPYCGSPTTPNGHHAPTPAAFPLDAEQIVRLTGAVLTRVLNAVRHPDAKRVDEAELTLGLARSAGVEVATVGEGWDRRLAPYGTETFDLDEGAKR